MRKDCPDGEDEKMCVECSFEKGECGWMPIPSDHADYNWVVTHPGNWSYNQPPNDTTLKNSSGIRRSHGNFALSPDLGHHGNPSVTVAGHYLMVTGHGGHNHVAEVESALMPRLEKGCKLSFNYQITGQHSDRLTMQLILHGMATQFWEISGDQVCTLDIADSPCPLDFLRL